MLRTNDPFPSLAFACTSGGNIRLPEDLAGWFSVVLFYRGAWCATCNTQLSAFAKATDELAGEGIKVAAVSVDDRPTTLALAAKHKLGFSLAYGADAQAVSAAIGAVPTDDPDFLQASGFVLDPASRILMGVYSSILVTEDRIVTEVGSTGKLDRLMPDDVLRLVRHAKSTSGR
jgi:peroxiredoxin